MHMNTRTKGFTIIELLVTVFIIALLTGIIISNLTDSKAKSRDGKRISDIGQLQLAFELYFDRCNEYPALAPANTSNNYLVDVNASNGCPTINGTQITLATFTSKIPTPPNVGEYRYAVNDVDHPTDYVLRAQLEKNNQAIQDAITNNTSFSSYPYLTTPSTRTTTTGLTCTHSSSPYYYCVQPR